MQNCLQVSCMAGVKAANQLGIQKAIVVETNCIMVNLALESGSIRLATEMLCLVGGGKNFRYHIGV